MLPQTIRYNLFDRLSVQTMRHVTSVKRREATGLVKEVYDMIADDFFINGSLTSHSRVPELLAGIWTAGRESILVDDHLDRTTKEAMTTMVSQINECAYCGDMLVSLVHAGDKHDEARKLHHRRTDEIEDSELRHRLQWTRNIVLGNHQPSMKLPFNPAALPEVIASIMAISHINRFSHIVMDGSPVKPVLGSNQIKTLSLRMFGGELKPSKRRKLKPDRTRNLLPQTALPDDMQWAVGNPRIARAIARWAGSIERSTPEVVPRHVRHRVEENVRRWDGSPMPISRSWVDTETADLTGEARDLTKFALVVAKSAPQMDEELVQRVFKDESQFVRLLAWASFTGARRIATLVAARCPAVHTATVIAS